MLLEDFNKKLAERDAEIEKLTRERDIALKGLDNIEVQRVGAVCKLEDTRVERDSFRDSAQKYERELIWAKESLNNVIGENHRHKDFIESQKVEVFAYRAEIERLRKALVEITAAPGCTTFWPPACSINCRAMKNAACQALASGKEENRRYIPDGQGNQLDVTTAGDLKGNVPLIDVDTLKHQARWAEIKNPTVKADAPKEVEKSCGNCLYEKKSAFVRPCGSCVGEGFSNWQPKSEAGKAVENG